MKHTSEVSLAPPGAGLPAAEHLLLRMMFPLLCLQKRAAHLDRFLVERSQIRSMIDSCDRVLLGRRILIPRLRGLEDSSRHWSVWMTLDHLRITNRAFAGVVQSLSQGKTPPGKADTAAVKPSPASGEEVMRLYEESCDAWLDLLGSLGPSPKEPRYTHPWFGPMNAEAWIALASTHMGIHRKQIAAILSKAQNDPDDRQSS